MEAIMVPSSPDQSLAPYNNKEHMKNPTRNTRRHFISRSTENFAAIHNGLLSTPPPSIQQQKKPPLLPLPVSKPCINSLPSRTRCLSCSPTTQKFNRITKKSKPSTTPKKGESKNESECLIIASTNRLGPDPNDLEKFSGSVFTLSPPPSSLPLPKFSLRPKLGCNAEATGIDVGATDNLRRLLRF